jgi:pimeloyl-ACP methyl ester carboxylesterase
VIVPIAVESGLAVYADGAGDPILLVPAPHACTLAPEIEKPLARLLVQAGYRVISFDPPGAFRSTRRPAVSMAEMIECCVEALGVAGLDGPVHVCGHSMASVCALGFALEHPAVVRSLALVATTSGPRAAIRYGGMPRCWSLWSASFWTFSVRGARLALGLGNLAVQNRLCEQTMRASFVKRELAPEIPVAKGERSMPASPRSAWAARIRGVEYEPRLGEIHVPVLVCAGRMDPQTTPRANAAVASRIPGARLVFFESSGHYPFAEERAKFARVAADFLAG